MKLGNLRIVIFLLVTFLLNGCSSSVPLLAVSKQVSYEEELKIAKLSQQLSRNDIDPETRLQLFFERGIAYDSIGLKAFAQSDFTQLLNLKVNISDIYNFLGNYLLRDGNFDEALLAFNTALELDKLDSFAYFNRAIVLYRTGHYQSAKLDAIKFYQFDSNDAIRMLWVYLIENEIDHQSAYKNLLKRYELLTDKTTYSSNFVAFYLGKINESELMQKLQQDVENNDQLAKRLCEAYFYLGKYYQNRGNNERAELLFKYAIASNIYNYVEHQQALYEMKLFVKE